MITAKRVFDIFFSLVGLSVLWLPLLAVGALIRLDGGPVFYPQERIGHRGRSFRIWKLRTMVVGADQIGLPLTVGRDPRITRVGHWLRKYKLDELPQLFNVLNGTMSLVGPRPEVPQYVLLYTPDQRRVLDLIPGITDPASVRFRNESDLLAASPDPFIAYCDRIMPEKIRINLEYAAHASLKTDLLMILRTLACLSS